MSDRDRETTPDSLPPEVDSDMRSDIEQAIDDGDADAAETIPADTSPLEPTGQPDGNAGTGGVTKNQDDLAQ